MKQAALVAPAMPPSSWWIGLDRRAFQREVAAREDGWRRQQRAFADFVGASLREGWTYEHKAPDLRGPIR